MPALKGRMPAKGQGVPGVKVVNNPNANERDTDGEWRQSWRAEGVNAGNELSRGLRSRILKTIYGGELS